MGVVKRVEVVDAQSGQRVFSAKTKPVKGQKWGQFQYQYLFDFSAIKQAGRFIIKAEETQSGPFSIDAQVFDHYEEDLLAFMRQQRCGYNPYFDEVCHQGDGRLFYAPVPDSTYQDCSGGWHDAGDQLKYLITGSNATARMLLAYELAPDRFEDHLRWPY
jgi:hypothetical protein